VINNGEFVNIINRHKDAYMWESEHIPLGVWINDVKKHNKISYNSTEFYKDLFDRQMEIVNDTVLFGSELVPVLGITNYGIAIVPSLFGAKITASSNDVDAVEEMGYWVHRIFDKIEDVEKYKLHFIESELFEKVCRHIEYYRDNAPKNYYISDSLDGPFSIAELLRGSAIYLDMYDKPHYVHKLMGLCTDMIIKCEDVLKTVAGYEKYNGDFPSYYGIWLPGLRLGDDSILNLSKDMIEEFVLPYYEKIALHFNCKLTVHFCTVGKPLGEQIIEAFIKPNYISGISTQLGTDLYEKYHDRIRNRLFIEAGYGDAFAYSINKHGSLRQFFNHIKNNISGSKGLILYTTAGSEKEAYNILKTWNEV